MIDIFRYLQVALAMDAEAIINDMVRFSKKYEKQTGNKAPVKKTISSWILGDECKIKSNGLKFIRMYCASKEVSLSIANQEMFSIAKKMVMDASMAIHSNQNALQEDGIDAIISLMKSNKSHLETMREDYIGSYYVVRYQKVEKAFFREMIIIADSGFSYLDAYMVNYLGRVFRGIMHPSRGHLYFIFARSHPMYDVVFRNLIVNRHADGNNDILTGVLTRVGDAGGLAIASEVLLHFVNKNKSDEAAKYIIETAPQTDQFDININIAKHIGKVGPSDKLFSLYSKILREPLVSHGIDEARAVWSNHLE